MPSTAAIVSGTAVRLSEPRGFSVPGRPGSPAATRARFTEAAAGGQRACAPPRVIRPGARARPRASKGGLRAGEIGRARKRVRLRGGDASETRHRQSRGRRCQASARLPGPIGHPGLAPQPTPPASITASMQARFTAALAAARLFALCEPKHHALRGPAAVLVGGQRLGPRKRPGPRPPSRPAGECVAVSAASIDDRPAGDVDDGGAGLHPARGPPRRSALAGRPRPAGSRA